MDSPLQFDLSEDCKQRTPKSSVFDKLNLKQETPEKIAMDLFRRAAARLVSSFSLTQKSCKTTEQGFNRASEWLATVEDHMRSAMKYQTSLQEKAIILSEHQADVFHGPICSTFITGTFGTGKTELAFQLIKKFCNYVQEKHRSMGIVIASVFSDRGYCTELLKEYDDMITQHLHRFSFTGWTDEGNYDMYRSIGISSVVGVKQWLLERYQIQETSCLVLVINKVMQRITKIHKRVPILLVLDEVSLPYGDQGGEWSRLIIPDNLTLVLILKPTIKADCLSMALHVP